MIKEFDDFLDEDECNMLIGLFESSDGKEKYRNTIILNVRNDSILKKLHKLFNIDLLLTPADMQIVKWPTGSFMNDHYDTGDQYGVLIYLNDNYEGGETIINKQKIKPRRGCGVLFSNGKLLHSVCEIKKGTRYVLPVWYK
jgi:hypothetical protein